MPESPFRAFDHTIGQSILRVDYCDITTLNVDVMVSSDDTDLSMGGGVSQALLRGAGQSVWRETQSQAPIPLGDVAVTTGGQLSAKRIFHAAVLDYARRDLTTIDLIRRVTKRCLYLCDEMGFKSIAFPALATGTARLSPERSAAAMLIEIAPHLSSKTILKTIILALYPRPGLPRNTLSRFYSQVQDLLERTEQVNTVNSSLENLERVYRELKSPYAVEEVVETREGLLRYRDLWEQEMLEREPGDSRHERSRREYRDDMEPELDRISSLRRHRQEFERNRPMDWERLESQYTEYRSAAVGEMIAIRRRNVTDIEKELTIRGFSTELRRALEYEKEQLQTLEAELRELRG
ncbi:MAG: macro domain-containing protein [Streptosporangiaceae bacterium]|jgi:O-acetyl-ADP-ribose deacetylase (regulator of RNase III)